MIYRFHVYHDYESAAGTIEGLMHALDSEREEHEYSCFPATLAHRFDFPSMSASSVLAPSQRGVVVTVETALSQTDVDVAIDRVLVDQNRAIRGLCLVASRVP